MRRVASYGGPSGVPSSERLKHRLSITAGMHLLSAADPDPEVGFLAPIVEGEGKRVVHSTSWATRNFLATAAGLKRFSIRQRIWTVRTAPLAALADSASEIAQQCSSESLTYPICSSEVVNFEDDCRCGRGGDIQSVHQSRSLRVHDVYDARLHLPAQDTVMEHSSATAPSMSQEHPCLTGTLSCCDNDPVVRDSVANSSTDSLQDWDRDQGPELRNSQGELVSPAGQATLVGGSGVSEKATSLDSPAELQETERGYSISTCRKARVVSKYRSPNDNMTDSSHVASAANSGYQEVLDKQVSSMLVQPVSQEGNFEAWMECDLQSMNAAALSIQRCYKGWLKRRQFVGLKGNVVGLPNSNQNHKQDQRICQAAVVLIQSCFRGFKERKQYRILKGAVIILQTLFRRKQSLNQDRQVRQTAAVLIQRWYRGWLQRMQYRIFKGIVIRLQTVFRQNQKLRQDKRFRQTAALSIQRSYKCWLERKQYKILKGTVIRLQTFFRTKQKWKQDQQVQQAAAVLIQCCYRGWLERRQYRSIKRFVLRLQGVFHRNEKLRQDLRCRQAAALSIQSSFRGWLERRKYMSLKGKIVRLQILIHRKRVLNQDQKIRQAAAVSIQNSFRGWLERRKYERLKQIVISLQALTRGKQTWKWYQRLRNASIILQKLWRAVKIRHLVYQLRLQKIVRDNAAAMIQAHARVHLCRLQIKKLGAASHIIQKTWLQHSGARSRATTLCTVHNYVNFTGENLQATLTVQTHPHPCIARCPTWHWHTAAKVIQHRWRAYRLSMCVIATSNTHAHTAISPTEPKERLCQLVLRFEKSAVLIQAQVRGHLVRKKLHQMHKAASVIQQLWHSTQSKRLTTSAVCIQSAYRAFAARKLLLLTSLSSVEGFQFQGHPAEQHLPTTKPHTDLWNVNVSAKENSSSRVCSLDSQTPTGSIAPDLNSLAAMGPLRIMNARPFRTVNDWFARQESQVLQVGGGAVDGASAFVQADTCMDQGNLCTTTVVVTEGSVLEPLPQKEDWNNVQVEHLEECLDTCVGNLRMWPLNGPVTCNAEQSSVLDVPEVSQLSKGNHTSSVKVIDNTSTNNTLGRTEGQTQVQVLMEQSRNHQVRNCSKHRTESAISSLHESHVSAVVTVAGDNSASCAESTLGGRDSVDLQQTNSICQNYGEFSNDQSPDIFFKSSSCAGVIDPFSLVVHGNLFSSLQSHNIKLQEMFCKTFISKTEMQGHRSLSRASKLNEERLQQFAQVFLLHRFITNQQQRAQLAPPFPPPPVLNHKTCNRLVTTDIVHDAKIGSCGIASKDVHFSDGKGEAFTPNFWHMTEANTKGKSATPVQTSVGRADEIPTEVTSRTNKGVGRWGGYEVAPKPDVVVDVVLLLRKLEGMYGESGLETEDNMRKPFLLKGDIEEGFVYEKNRYEMSTETQNSKMSFAGAVGIKRMGLPDVNAVFLMLIAMVLYTRTVCRGVLFRTRETNREQ